MQCLLSLSRSRNKKKIIHPLRVFVINIRSDKSVLCFLFLSFSLERAVWGEGEGGRGGGYLGQQQYTIHVSPHSHTSQAITTHPSWKCGQLPVQTQPPTTPATMDVDVPDLFSQSG